MDTVIRTKGDVMTTIFSASRLPRHPRTLRAVRVLNVMHWLTGLLPDQLRVAQ